MALEDRERTFLAEDPWQSIPWSDAPDSKSYINRFVDIILCVPGIMQDLDCLQTESAERPRIDDVKEAIKSLSARTLDARLDWETLNPNAAREVVPSVIKPYSAVDENGDLLFDSVLHYKNLQLCVEMGIYFATVFFLRCFSEAVGDTSHVDTQTQFSAPRRNPVLQLPHEMPSYRDSAVQICRSVEFYLQSGHGLAGAYFLLFPLRVAQYAFDYTKDYAIAMWIRRVMKYIGDEYGFSNALRFAT